MIAGSLSHGSDFICCMSRPDASHVDTVAWADKQLKEVRSAKGMERAEKGAEGAPVGPDGADLRDLLGRHTVDPAADADDKKD